MKTKQCLRALCLFLPVVQAQAWTGTGEFGLAASRGNADADTLNAKLDVRKEDAQWLYQASADALRVKANDDLTANRFQLGGKLGYKHTERMYFSTTARYDRDDFAPYDFQYVLGAGAGYFFAKSATTELSAELGPAWRRYRPVVTGYGPGMASDWVVRAGANFKRTLTQTTSLYNALLVETGADQGFLQNDLGVAVKISEPFALKAGFQVRRHRKTQVGNDHTDTVFTTNLLMNF